MSKANIVLRSYKALNIAMLFNLLISVCLSVFLAMYRSEWKGGETGSHKYLPSETFTDGLTLLKVKSTQVGAQHNFSCDGKVHC